MYLILASVHMKTINTKRYLLFKIDDSNIHLKHNFKKNEDKINGTIF